MNIVFDPAKNAANLAKHGLDLADAATMWAEGAVIEAEDTRRDYGERRMVAVGPVGGRICVAVYTDTADARRIISFRRANRRESDAYHARIRQAGPPVEE